MIQEHKRAYTSMFLLYYHFVWIPRRRRKVLQGKVEQSLKCLLRRKAQEINFDILAPKIMPDHVHLFVNTPSNLEANQIMHRLKGYTSRLLRQTYSHLRRMPSMWTRSYFVSTEQQGTIA